MQENNLPPEDNQNKVYTVIGATGSGKTPFVVGGKFEKGLANIFLQKNMSTLTIDEIDHHKYAHIPIIGPSQYDMLGKKVGLYRTIVQLQYMRSLVRDIVFKKLVYNSLLVFEDSKKWVSNNWDAGEKLELTLIGNSKQQNVDLVFMFWSWKQVPPKLFEMTKYLVIFNTSSGPAPRKNDLGDCYEDCLTAHNLIKRKKFVNNLPYYIVSTGL